MGRIRELNRHIREVFCQIREGCPWLGSPLLRGRANPGDVERLLLDTAARDGKRVPVGFGRDPGQAGKSQALHLVRALSGFTVAPGDREWRQAHQVRAVQLAVPRR